jgi:hypothetical protein
MYWSCFFFQLQYILFTQRHMPKTASYAQDIVDSKNVGGSPGSEFLDDDNFERKKNETFLKNKN